MDRLLMECDRCGATWEEDFGAADVCCPDCGDGLVHRFVADHVVERMRGILSSRTVKAERLKAAFAACTSGGDEFAQLVLEKALRRGLIVAENGTVRNASVWEMEEPF